MSIGTAVLQPHSLGRAADDSVQGLMEDILRLVTLFAEDAMAGGTMSAETEPALQEAGQVLLQWMEAPGPDGTKRLDGVVAKLQGRLAPVRGLIESLSGGVDAIGDDPALVIGMIRQILTLAQGAAGALTLPAIRSELTFVKTLIEEDLGFGPAFIGDRMADFLTILRRRLAALPDPGTVVARRRLRLARAILGRLALQTRFLRPPAFDIEPLARALFELLESSGLTKALGEVSCALDGIEATFNAAVAAGEAVRVVTQPVNAGVVPMPNAAEYAHYASWLLNDEDMPLIGLSDMKNPATFINHVKSASHPVIATLRGRMPIETAGALSRYNTADGAPDEDLQLSVLAALNMEIQKGPILDIGGSPLMPVDGLPEKVRDLRRDYRKDQSLYRYNRRLLDHVFGDDLISTLDGWDSNRAFGRIVLNLIAWPRNQVYVTGDRRYVMCDDMPMLAGENVKWNDAPVLKGEPIDGGMWFRFAHRTPRFCELWAQVWTNLLETGKAIWHLVEVQPGHEAQAALVGSIELADSLQMFLFGKPLSGHMLQGNPHLRRWGKSLDSLLGLKGIAVVLCSLQSMQTEAPTEKGRFWLTVFLGDFFRTLGPISTLNTARDILIGSVALVDHGGPDGGPVIPPQNAPRNHKKQQGWVGAADAGMTIALMSLYPRDAYGVGIWSEDGIADIRAEAMAGHWLGGSLGFGFLAGIGGSLISMAFARVFDWKRMLETVGISTGKLFGLYWIFNYTFRENSTDGGRYMAGAATQFRSYPDKSRAPSPYLLPFPGGRAHFTGQANLGLFSHNYLANMDFATPEDSSTQQVYAYDFGHDFREPIACCRDGFVWSVTEDKADGNTTDRNAIIIRHATIDNEHDDFGNGPVQTFSVYIHLAQNGVTQAPFWGGVTPAQELTAGIGAGAAVTQGDLIALAGDTGKSFHNHLHMHVVRQMPGGTGPDINPTLAVPLVYTVPFVFQDAPGNGVLKSTTWYRSGNRP